MYRKIAKIMQWVPLCCCLVAKLCLTLSQPHGLYLARQSPLSMGFSRQEYWSGLLFPSLRDLPYPRIEPRSPALQANALTSEPPGNIYICICFYTVIWASLVAQLVKHLPAMQETPVWFLGWEDPLEKEMATHSSILAWKTPWMEEPGRL